MLIVDKDCSDVCSDEFPVPQIDHKSKQVKNSDMKNFICSKYGGKLTIFNIPKISKFVDG